MYYTIKHDGQYLVKVHIEGGNLEAEFKLGKEPIWFNDMAEILVLYTFILLRYPGLKRTMKIITFEDFHTMLRRCGDFKGCADYEI